MATIKAIITGSTGMVGEGVLHECLQHPDVESVLVLNRRPCGVQHPKLREILHGDFSNIKPIAEQLSGYNAFFFCMGVSSIGKNETDYTRITHDTTLHIATTVVQHNPDMTFCYVSGSGTDSTEKGRSMWARVKGKTENDLLALPFKAAYMFRPGYIQPTAGLKNAYTAYRFFAPLYPLWKRLFPAYVCTLEHLGLAMIRVANTGYTQPILENRDIERCGENANQN